MKKRNCRDRARRAAETPVEKKNRLDKRKAALANESMVQRDSRLQNALVYYCSRLNLRNKEKLAC